MELEFRILGSLEVLDGERAVALPRGRARALLAILALHPGETVSTDRLIAELWGETPPRTATTALQGLVSSLRKCLQPGRAGGMAPAVLETRPAGYALAVDPEQVDAPRFRRLVVEAEHAPDPGRKAARLREALALWRGPALADFVYEPFARGNVAELEELRLAAIEERVDADLALGRRGELVGELESLVSQHPLRERLRGQLMLALYRSGRQAEALEAYRDARRVLVDELGIEPGPALQSLEQAILRQDPSLEVAPPRESPRRPERPQGNLPEPLTSFVGRGREIEQVKALLSRARLVTLTGPGGCGKTRLALRVASEVVPDFGDGAFFVSLASLADPSLIVPTVARALGVQERPGEPVVDTLKRHLASREMLLVLDNFEHLVEASPVVTELLQAAPGVKALVTSREILHLSGEHEFAVPPLELPDPGRMPPLAELLEIDAVALFIQRAEVTDPRFRVDDTSGAAVAEICLRLDGLSLSIELAASRIQTFEPEELLARLTDSLSLLRDGPRDVPARQRSLRDTIAWSHDLLSEAEQLVFRRLGIFVRGCTIEAARAVIDPGGGAGVELGEALGSLVDKSLLLREAKLGEPRFRMLETIREFARAALVAEDDLVQAAGRHAEFFLRLAEQADPHLLGPEGVAWLDRVEEDHDNIRAALRWAIDTGDAEVGMRLGGALWRFWHQRGHLREGRRWLEEVLSLPQATESTAYRAKALTALGGLAYWQSDYEAAGVAYKETLELCRA